MNDRPGEELPLQSDEDIVRARQVTRTWALDLGFSLVDQTKIVTAASELARNTLIHGGGGLTRLEALQDGARRGLRLTFTDKGPGIPDVQQALQINGGNRIPVLVFFSEDGFEVARCGERTLSKYRQMMRDQIGESCPTGVALPGDPLLVQVTQDWLNEFERVQYILRLSPRLRRRHGD